MADTETLPERRQALLRRQAELEREVRKTHDGYYPAGQQAEILRALGGEEREVGAQLQEIDEALGITPVVRLDQGRPYFDFTGGTGGIMGRTAPRADPSRWLCRY
jgi:hypothetical protein